MIVDIADIFQGTAKKKELDAISINLPQIFSMQSLGTSEGKNKYHLYVIPKIYPISENDMLLHKKNSKTNFGEFNIYSKFSDRIKFKLDNICEKYKNFDIFCDTEKNTSILEMILAFEGENFPVFGYKKCNFYSKGLYWFGSITKTDSNDWKFYPKFLDCKISIDEIIQKYKRGEYLE